MITAEALDALGNALQLSIKSKIQHITQTAGQALVIQLERLAPRDRGWNDFCRLLPGRWDAKALTWTVAAPNAADISRLITFMLLTRLQYPQMQKLAELDSVYGPYFAVLGAHALVRRLSTHLPIDTVPAAVTAIFQHIAQQRLTLRVVAEKSGLTQVSISKFKAGGDIKLSSLLKIIQAVGLKLWMG